MPSDVHSAAETLRAREAAAREARRARAEQTQERVVSELRSVLGEGERAWLYGSLVWGGFGEHSDVDLALSRVSRAKLLEIERRVARAAEAPVDLADLEELPPGLRARIEREGVCVP